MNNSSFDLQLVLCPVRDPETKHRDIYNKIYQCWNSVWTAAYAEAKCQRRDDALKSDSFTRQDFVAALFHKEECIAFILFRYAHLGSLSTKDDSFFSQWSEIHLKKVSKIGDDLLICGNLGVLPTFRQKTLGVSLKEIIGGVIAEITLQSTVDATLATPRRDRNVQKAAYQWGAVPIAQDIPWGFDINVDLILFHKSQLLKCRDHALRPLIDELWLNKLIIEKLNTETIQDFKNTVPYSLQSTKIDKKTG